MGLLDRLKRWASGEPPALTKRQERLLAYLDFLHDNYCDDIFEAAERATLYGKIRKREQFFVRQRVEKEWEERR